MANSEMIGAGQDTTRPAPEINTITCGDCLQVMKQIPDKSVDMILCDLPYGTTACKWDVVIPFEPLWVQYKRIIKNREAIVLFGSEPFSSYLRMSNIKQYKYDLVWLKGRGSEPALAKLRPQKAHETLSVFALGGRNPNYYPQMIPRDKPKIIKGNYSNNGLGILSGSGIIEKKYTARFPLSYMEFRNSGQSVKVHPTQKPVALLEYLIKTYTLEGETVLDNCIGSGTTAIACINTGRNFIGIEKEEKYCQIAEERIRALRSPVQNTKGTRHTAMLKIFFTF